MTQTNYVQAPDTVDRKTTKARYVVVAHIKPYKRQAQNDDTELSRAGILSNLYPCSVKVFELCFMSTEHDYHYMKARYHGREDLTEKLYKHPNACGSKKLAKQVVTEGCLEEKRWRP